MKIKPFETAFTELADPRAILEKMISTNYPVLSQGEIIAIKYLDQEYHIEIVECKPGPVIQALNCDINLEFDTPYDYVEKPVEEVEEEIVIDDEDKIKQENINFKFISSLNSWEVASSSGIKNYNSDNLAFDGFKLKINGVPSDGDQFSLKPSSSNASAFSFSSSVASPISEGATALKLENEIHEETVNDVEQFDQNNNEVQTNTLESEETIAEETQSIVEPEVSNGLENFEIEEETPELFNSGNEENSSSDEISDSKETDSLDEDDLEIPAFLRRQKN